MESLPGRKRPIAEHYNDLDRPFFPHLRGWVHAPICAKNGHPRALRHAQQFDFHSAAIVKKGRKRKRTFTFRRCSPQIRPKEETRPGCYAWTGFLVSAAVSFNRLSNPLV